MQFLPTDSDSRLLPVALLLISLILVYMLGFHWFVLRHATLNDDIGSLESRYTSMKAVTLQRETLAEQLGKLRTTQQELDLFLPEVNANAAAAGMTDRLKQVISSEADDRSSCNVVSSQPVRTRLEERFQRSSVNIRMNCNIPDFVKVLYKLESQRPMMLVEELNLYKITPRRTRGKTVEATTTRLDIRFNLTGYIRSRGADK
ncbi:MAG: type II secretion system protein GspM [Xanthomonadales bacterium]|nr:type II secretion system protein GspM [Xanthomonadales bacterium]